MDTSPSSPAAPAPPLEAWLEEATNGLADEARERIRSEIVDHVAESVAERCAAGAAPDEALAAAVEALGDAARARRALRRANLTRSEAKLVGGLATPAPRWVVALYLLGIPTFAFTVFWWVDGTRDQIVFILTYLGLVAGIAAMFSLARALARKGMLRAALIADVFGRWLFYASLIIGSHLIIQGEARLHGAVYAGAFVLALLLVARVWPKIGRRRARSS